MINIGSRRECFFDDFLLDSKTTASFMLHHPKKCEAIMTHDAPWEGDNCIAHNFFFDKHYHGFDGSHPNGVYRMYYVGLRSDYPYSVYAGDDYNGSFVICYAESDDGLNWIKPSLGLFQWKGNYDNNIVVGPELHPECCSFTVFYDENPDCPEDERYKAITSWDDPKGPNGEIGEFRLFTFLSPDGIHFRKGDMITNKGFFDSLNIVMWDKSAEKYRCFARGVHVKGQDPTSGEMADSWDKIGGFIRNEMNTNKAFPPVIRDILYYESYDYKTWTDPVWLRYDDGKELQMYTNGIMQYPRAPHMFIGLPTRYNERSEWTGNYDELCGKEKRRVRIEHDNSIRSGTAFTDCAFMTSRDGINFHRYGTAFMSAGEETGRNWLYGDCYPTPNFALTPSTYEGAPDELSFYCVENHLLGIPAVLYRYTLRLDGFASLHADDEEKLVITKPFTYDGDNLYINFASSAFGYIYFTLVSEDGERFESCETFGNTVDRRVIFNDTSAVSKLSGKKVTLEMRMFDSDIYSMRFGE